MAAEEPFASAVAGPPPPDPAGTVLAPEAYAALLFALGLRRQVVRLHVHGHWLDASALVVDWVRGTTLTRWSTRMPPDLFARFVERYRTRLLQVVGDRSPYFYTLKRILMWGQR